MLYLEEIWEALPEHTGGLSEELAVVLAELDKLKGQRCIVEELSRDISEQVPVDCIGVHSCHFAWEDTACY